MTHCANSAHRSGAEKKALPDLITLSHESVALGDVLNTFATTRKQSPLPIPMTDSLGARQEASRSRSSTKLLSSFSSLIGRRRKYPKLE
jgi:hypothetical protein